MSPLEHRPVGLDNHRIAVPLGNGVVALQDVNTKRMLATLGPTLHAKLAHVAKVATSVVVQRPRHRLYSTPGILAPVHLQFPIRSDKLTMQVAVSAHIAHHQSPFQSIDIYDTPVFGRILFLDGHVQLAEFDEFAYHEALVHVPLLNIDQPRHALVIGGGDGGVVRELTRNPYLETIHMVEIDQAVIDVCREHLPSLSDGAFDDPRVTVYVEDAFPFVKNLTEPYDLIVMDSTDVYEEEDGGLSEQLWTPDFYRDLHRLLSPKGILVTQADNLLFCPYSLEGILRTFGEIFPATGSYQAIVPSFGGWSGYAWASHGAKLAPSRPATQQELRYLTELSYQVALNPLPF